VNSGIPFTRIADRVEVNVAPRGRAHQRPSDGPEEVLTGVAICARLSELRMRYLSQEQRSIFLLVFILLFIILTPFLEGDPGGELILVVNMYLTLVAATMELKEKRALFLSAIPIAATSMVLMLLNYFRPTRGLYWRSSLGSFR
jgi:hypothetical protein